MDDFENTRKKIKSVGLNVYDNERAIMSLFNVRKKVCYLIVIVALVICMPVTSVPMSQ